MDTNHRIESKNTGNMDEILFLPPSSVTSTTTAVSTTDSAPKDHEGKPTTTTTTTINATTIRKDSHLTTNVIHHHNTYALEKNATSSTSIAIEPPKKKAKTQQLAITKRGLQDSKRYNDPIHGLSVVSKNFLSSIHIHNAAEFLSTRTTDIATHFVTWREKEGLPSLKGLGAIASVSGWKSSCRKIAKEMSLEDVADMEPPGSYLKLQRKMDHNSNNSSSNKNDNNNKNKHNNYIKTNAKAMSLQRKQLSPLSQSSAKTAFLSKPSNLLNTTTGLMPTHKIPRSHVHGVVPTTTTGSLCLNPTATQKIRRYYTCPSSNGT
jgi:hypothetical protein